MNDKNKKKEDNIIRTGHAGAAHDREEETGNEMHESADRPQGSDHGDQGRASHVTGSATQGGSNFGQGSASLGGESYKQGDTKNTGSDYENEKGRFAETGTGADGKNSKSTGSGQVSTENTNTTSPNDSNQDVEGQRGGETN